MHVFTRSHHLRILQAFGQRVLAAVLFVSTVAAPLLAQPTALNHLPHAAKRHVSPAGGGIISTYAGNNTYGNGGYGGPAIQAQLAYPTSVAVDPAGNLYIANFGEGFVNKVDHSTGIISLYAGGGSSWANGVPATQALIYALGLAVDSVGNLYIADAYSAIRKVDHTTGIVTTIVGFPSSPGSPFGSPGYSGDGGLATQAQINQPRGLAVDTHGNIYIADTLNNAIRKVNAASGFIETIAGIAPGVTAGCAQQTDSNGDGCAATLATLNDPNDVAVDSTGNMYIADVGSSEIREVGGNGVISVIVGGAGAGCTQQTDALGDGCPAPYAILGNSFYDVILDSLGNIYISDDNVVRVVDSSTGIISTLAGVPNNAGYSGDGGPPTGALLGTATGLAFDSLGNLFIADFAENVVRRITYDDTAAFAPIFSPPAGRYLAAQSVSIINGTDGATVYYTTDGSAPNASSPVYTTPIPVSENTTIQAVAIATGYADSPTASATYLIGPAPTATALSLASAGKAATSIKAGAIVTLTAAVTSGSALVTPGQVNFCNAAAVSCTESGLLGTSQLTGNGTALLRLSPVAGSHSYKAIFIGTDAYQPSTSANAPLTVTAPTGGTGSFVTTTSITPSANGSPYTLNATVGTSETGNLPTGSVSFLDASNGNAVLGTASLSSGTKGVTFYNASNPSAGDTPNAIAAGDFNNDGIPDLATANTNDQTVTVLLGNGDGTFNASSQLPQTDVQPESVVTGDFNGDGDLDIAVQNDIGQSVTVLLGNGTGAFTSSTNDYINGTTTAMATADFNGDGLLDLAIPIPAGAYVEVQQGDGKGNFSDFSSTPPTIGLGNTPSITIADFNGDGIADMAVGDSGLNQVTVILGNGDGSFSNGATLTTGSGPVAITVGDFNGDGKADIAVVNSGNDTVSIFLGTGNGKTFTTVSSTPSTGKGPTAIAAGDFNGDGKTDLVISNFNDSTLTVLLGNGNGTFILGAAPVTDAGPRGLAVADFNGDGLPDIAVTCAYSQTVTILLAQLGETVQVTGITPPNGGEQVFAQYAGDSNFKSSKSGQITLTGPKIATKETFKSSPNPQVVGQSVTFSATVTPTAGTGVPTGTISSTIDGNPGPTVPLNGGAASYSANNLTVGSHTIVATYSGDTNYSGTSASLIQVITTDPAASISAVSGSGQSVVYGAITAPLVVLVKDSGSTPLSGVTVTFTAKGLKLSSSTAITGSNGQASVTAIATAVSNLTATASTSGVTGSASFTLTGTPALLTITANNASSTYDQPLAKVTYTVTGFVNGDTSNVLTGAPVETTTATSTSAPGTYPIIITQGALAATNYSFKFVNGTYTINTLGTVATPAFSPAAGTYSTPQSVSIADNTPGAVIYYTLNGVQPTTASTKYSGPIIVANTETIQAIAVATNYSQSAVALATYTITQGMISLAPTTLAFPTTITNSTSPVQVVTLANTGTTAVTAKSYTIAGTNASSFLLSNKTCGTTIAAGASCTISIAFRPTAAGTLTASLLATDNASGSPQSVALTGTGQLPPTVTVTPNKLTFPATTLGSAAAPQVITVKNIGTATVTVQSYKFTGTNASDYTLSAKTCTTSLAAGASCTLTVTFKPTAAGALSASLVASDSSPGSPQTIALTGTGVTQPTVSLSPSTLAFPATKVGVKSATQTVTLTNTGQTALTVHSFTFTGTNASSFLIASKTCGTSLAVGASCTLSVAFKPTTTGTLTGKLSVSDNAVGTPQTTSLSGTGQ